MINAYAGQPGSGKTYYAVARDLIPKLINSECKIYHSIKGLNLYRIAVDYELDLYKLRERVEFLGDDDTQTPDKEKIRGLADRVESGDIPNGSYFLLDELQDVFPAKAITADERITPEWIHLITNHRHHNIDMSFMTQHVESVEITWRRQIEILRVFRGLGFLGLKRNYTCGCYIRSGNKQVYYKDEKGRYQPRFYPYYQSFDCEVSEDDLRKKYSGNTIFKPWYFLVAASLLFCFLSLLYKGNGTVARAIIGGENNAVSSGSSHSSISPAPAVPVSDSSASAPRMETSTGSLTSSPSANGNTERKDGPPVPTVPILVGCVGFETDNDSVYYASVQGPDGRFYRFRFPCLDLTVGKPFILSLDEVRMLSLSDQLQAGRETIEDRLSLNAR
ncbi:MAG: hypothetical protein HZA04_02575 [Nitrospinae bacterium]|nr:hypothetical protein [Nitrospinota bacterium]